MTNNLVQALPKGDILVFDRSARELYIIDKSGAKEWKAGKQSIAEARALAQKGQALHLDRRALQKVTQALAGVVLLAGPT